MTTWSGSEMRYASVKDARRRNSLAVALYGLAEKPSAPFSTAVGPAKRQAMRRLFSSETEGEQGNGRVEVSDLLSGHTGETRSRIAEDTRGGLILLVQDTTMYNFAGLKGTEGLGYCNTKGERCIFGHSMLALTVSGLPLGVTYLDLWVRDNAQHGKAKSRRELDIKDKESYRWIAALKSTEALLPEHQPALFIQDREADIFAFLEAPERATSYVLVRAAHPRSVEVDSADGAWSVRGRLLDVACEAPTVARMQVQVPRAPNRNELAVDLVVQATPLRILAPKDRKGVTGNPLNAWVVRARELDPPEGEKAIEWILVTTMPVNSAEDACQLVRYYSKRWTIERLHYTIKSGGCNAERLQMDDVYSLKLALALYYITAWRLLFITYLARVKPETPVNVILGDAEIDVLCKKENRQITTCAEAVIAIAKLGGYEYYKNGPPPGVKRLWIGLRRLEDMALGWLAAKQNLPILQGLRYDT